MSEDLIRQRILDEILYHKNETSFVYHCAPQADFPGVGNLGEKVSSFVRGLGFKCSSNYEYFMQTGNGFIDFKIEHTKEQLSDPYACQFCLGSKKLIPLENQEKQMLNARADRRCFSCGRELIVAEMIRIVGPYTMVEPLIKEVKSKVGLIIPSTCWRVWRIGRVVKLGEREVFWAERAGKRKSYNQTVIDIPKGEYFNRPEVDIGDIVMFQDLSVRPVTAGCNSYFLVHYDDLEMVVDSEDSVVPM